MDREFYRVPLSSVKLDEHHCSTVVARCVDWRFREEDQKSIKEGLGIDDFDLIGVPAPAKVLLTSSSARSYLTDIITLCMNLHGIQRLILLDHWDCGGYGGSKQFASPDEEERKYRGDLLELRPMLQRQFPSITIEAAYSKPVDDEMIYVLVGER